MKLAPQSNDVSDGTTLGRLTMEKRFHGDLDGTSKGEMLSAGTATKGSAGYVAIEVERMGEGQRFVTKLLTERAAQQLPEAAMNPSAGRVTTPH